MVDVQCLGEKKHHRCIFLNRFEEIYQMNGGVGGPASTYEQATKFNYTNEDKYTLVEVIGMIKG